jgi:2TM domain
MHHHPAPSPSNPLSDDDLNRLAHKRVKAKMGWFIHAAFYVTINVFLIAMSLIGGRHWFVFPLLGWGLGLAIHGIAVFAALPGSAWRERMVALERSRLQAVQGTW